MTAAVDSPQNLRVRVVCATTVFIAALVLYACTLAPTVTLIDSGELIVAARSLGVAHPPGFPLYVLLAHLATLVPIGNVAVRVNFASALFAALACSLLTLVVFEAMTTARLPKRESAGRKKADRGRKGKRTVASEANTPNEPANQSPLSLVVSCLVSGLLLAFSRTLWGYATIAEVYTLNALLTLAVFFLMFRWRREVFENRAQKQVPSAPDRVPSVDRTLYAAAFVFGLALGVHHVTVALTLPALAALVVATDGIKFFKTKRLLFAALFSCGGLILVYAYLPIAASRSPLMNWGNPRTLERLWWHISGRQYQVFLSFSLTTMVSQFGDFIKLAAREFGPWWLPAGLLLAITGLVSLFRRDKGTFWFLVLAIAADLAYCLGYEIAEDKDAYYLPVFIALTIAAGFGVQWLIHKVMIMRPASRSASYAAIAVIILVPIGELLAHFSYDNRSRYLIAQDYVDNILSTIEPGGMLLTRDWQVYSPMLYFREIEHRRSDAVVIDVNQLRRSWYFDYLDRAYPATMEQARDKVSAFLEDLRQWEQTPALYDTDLTLNQRINSRFYEMIRAFVANHVQGAPVYVTLDIAATRDGPDAELSKALASSYQLIPQGLVFQVTPDRGFLQPAHPQLVTRGLNDGTISFADDDVVKVKVLPVYVTMLYNRGRYLAANGRFDQAIEAFNETLALQPSFTAAQQGISESQTAIRKAASKSVQ